MGTISDEIESLRKADKTDEEIANLIEAKSRIRVSAAELAEKFASSEDRGGERGSSELAQPSKPRCIM